LARLASDFATPDSLGPRRAAAFEGEVVSEGVEATADAHGYVDDLLRACRDVDALSAKTTSS
jgi:hypothetical protein